MAEWAVVIEAWFESDNEEDAVAFSTALGERVLEYRNVTLVETQRPEPLEEAL